jgi:hypothetical protein
VTFISGSETYSVSRSVSSNQVNVKGNNIAGSVRLEVARVVFVLVATASVDVAVVA